jgi:hypothetical protein
VNARLLNRDNGSILLAIATAFLASGCITDKDNLGADGLATDADGLVIASADGNRMPVIAGTPASSIEAGTEYVLQASASDADGDPLTFQIQGLPRWAQFDSTNGTLRGSPTVDDVGDSADITLSVSDGKVTNTLRPFRISVKQSKTTAPVSSPGTAAPVISGTPTTTATVASAYSFKATATDADSLTLTFAIANKPDWASFSTTTGTLQGTPVAASIKTYSNIVISVTDGKATAALPAFAIVVQAAANRAPSIAGLAAVTATVGTAYSFQPTASDPDGNTLGYSIVNKPSWATFSTATGALTGTPTVAAIGSYSNISISVSDGKATTALAAFTLTVQGAANGAPTITGTPASSVIAGAAYSFQPAAADPNGDPLTYSVSGKPSWATFDITNGTLSGTPSGSNVGSYANIVITTSDGKSSSSLPAFSIIVLQQQSNGSATLSWNPPTQNTDGSALQNLAGYRIYHGNSQGSMTNQVTVTNAGLTSYVIASLGAGTHYFGITAYTSDGIESQMSNIGSKTIM